MSAKKRAVNTAGSDDGDVNEKINTSPASKKPKADVNKVFELGGRKKVSIGEYLGKKLVNIREFYEDKATGEEKPGNKGIALNIEQWNNLVRQINEIDEIVKGL